MIFELYTLLLITALKYQSLNEKLMRRTEAGQLSRVCVYVSVWKKQQCICLYNNKNLNKPLLQSRHLQVLCRLILINSGHQQNKVLRYGDREFVTA